MKRIHLSASHYLNTNVSYIPWMAADYPLKPSGLWYALGSEWQEWCDKHKAEQYTDYRFRYELTVDLSKICVLDDVDRVMEFHYKYGYKRAGNYTAIDWAKVKNDYSGIEVRNYEEVNFACSFRAVIWLKSWAVSSGCIWDLTALDLDDLQPTAVK